MACIRRSLPAFCGGLLLSLAVAAPARAVTSLVQRSSTAYDTGGSDAARAAAALANNGIVVTGQAGDEFHTVRYTKDLVFVTSHSFFSGGGGAEAVAVDPSGNIVVAGSSNSVKFVTVKYTPDLGFISSATFTAGGSSDRAHAVAVDGSSNVIVAGESLVGITRYFSVVKYNPSLQQTASVLYNGGVGGWQAIAFGVAVDAGGSILVTGQVQVAGHFDFLTVKFSPDLGTVQAVHRLDNLAQEDQARGIALDSAGKVIVAGKTSADGGSTYDVLVAKYDDALALQTTGAFQMGGNEAAEGVAMDFQDNACVVGTVDMGGPGDLLAVKFSPTLALISSATLDSGAADAGHAITVDSLGNIRAVGETNDSVNPADFLTAKFIGPPIVNSSGRGQQGGAFQVITIQGENFILGDVVSFSTGSIDFNGAAPYNPEQLGFNIDIPADTAIGFYDITVTHPDGASDTLPQGFEVVYAQAITASLDQTAVATGRAGEIRIEIPAGAFPADFTLTVASPTLIPDPTPLFFAGAAMELSVVPAVGQPTSSVTIRMQYREEDIVGLDVENLCLSYYDIGLNAWENLPTVVDPALRRITATTKNFAVLALLTRISPPSNVGKIKVYPNPYKPGSGGLYDDPPNWHGIIFTGLTETARIQVVSVTGELVWEYSGATSRAQVFWDTRNRYGQLAGSGVYVYTAHDGSDGRLLRRGKFSIIR